MYVKCVRIWYKIQHLYPKIDYTQLNRNCTALLLQLLLIKEFANLATYLFIVDVNFFYHLDLTPRDTRLNWRNERGMKVEVLEWVLDAWEAFFNDESTRRSRLRDYCDILTARSSVSTIRWLFLRVRVMMFPLAFLFPGGVYSTGVALATFTSSMTSVSQMYLGLSRPFTNWNKKGKKLKYLLPVDAVS